MKTARVYRVPYSTIQAILESIDGHTVFSPEYLTDAGFPLEVVYAMSANYGTGVDEKTTLYGADGYPIQMFGVQDLDLLEAIMLGMVRSAGYDMPKEYEELRNEVRWHHMGRGLKADILKRALKAISERMDQDRIARGDTSDLFALEFILQTRLQWKSYSGTADRNFASSQRRMNLRDHHRKTLLVLMQDDVTVIETHLEYTS